MTLDRLGSHWLHPDRLLHGRPYVSVELLYARDALPGFGWDETAERVAVARSKGADVALRVDWKHRQVLPPENDQAGVFDYVQACQAAVAQMSPDWLICGNEPNLHSECGGQPISPEWVARVVYGHGRPPEETDNCYQFARTANPTVEVLAPPVGPYSPDTWGNDDGCYPPDGRTDMAPWETYQYDLARRCYDNGGHVPELGLIKFAMHTYGRVGPLGEDNGGPEEPWQDVREETYLAQFGTRWLQDALYLCRQGMLRSPYGTDLYPGGILISEANTLTDGSPDESYPRGWWPNLIRYVDQFPNVLGLAAFVDQDYGGSWASCAMSTRTGRLADWDDDHNRCLEEGW